MPLGISKNLFQRIVSAVLLLPPVLGALWAGGWYFSAFLMLGGVLMAREWTALTSPGQRFSGNILSVLVVAIVIQTHTGNTGIANWALFLATTLVVGYVLIRVKAAVDFGWLMIGLSYVGAPLIALWWLRTLDAGLLVLWVFFIVWATDIGGYFFGKGIGGPKLAPKLSPKKTWAGLLGGMAFSIAVGSALHFAFSFVPSITVLVVTSGLLAVWAQAGDLVESGIKRHFKVKDSGELIPGHGGLLDRVDGLVFVAPAMALLMAWYPTMFLAG